MFNVETTPDCHVCPFTVRVPLFTFTVALPPLFSPKNKPVKVAEPLKRLKEAVCAALIAI
jgi:hypothetical protein